jgi:hypothetical protein
MTVSYLPAGSSKAEIRSLPAITDTTAAKFTAARFTRVAREKTAVFLIGVGLVATVLWVATLGWAIGLVLRLW